MDNLYWLDQERGTAHKKAREIPGSDRGGDTNDQQPNNGQIYSWSGAKGIRWSSKIKNAVLILTR